MEQMSAMEFTGGEPCRDTAAPVFAPLAALQAASAMSPLEDADFRWWSFAAQPGEEVQYHNAATCPDCGTGMVRLGLCYSCPSCGWGTCGA